MTKRRKSFFKQKVVATGGLLIFSANYKTKKSLVPYLPQSALAVRMIFFYSFSNLKSSASMILTVVCRAVYLCSMSPQLRHAKSSCTLFHGYVEVKTHFGECLSCQMGGELLLKKMRAMCKPALQLDI